MTRMQRSEYQILNALEDLSFGYRVYQTDDDLPLVQFAWGSDLIPEIYLTALEKNGVLRLTAHKLEETRDIPNQDTIVHRRSLELPLARVYRNPDNGTVEIGFNVHIGGGRFGGDELLAMLFQLGTSVTYLENRKQPVRGLPPVDGSESVDMEQSMKNIEVTAHRMGRAWIHRCVLPRLDINSEISIQHEGPGWIVLRGELVPAVKLDRQPSFDELVHRLQRWAPIGRYLFDPDLRTIGAEIAIPLLGRRVDQTIEFGLEEIQRLLGTVVVQMNKLNKTGG